MAGQTLLPHVGTLVITNKVILFNGVAQLQAVEAAVKIFIGAQAQLVAQDGTNAELTLHLVAWHLEKVHSDLVDLTDSVMLVVSEAAAEHLIQADSKAKDVATQGTGHTLDVQD